MTLDEQERVALKRVALDSIQHGVDRGAPLPIDPVQFPAPLREPAATFVTLEKDGDLRGCIGHLQADRPLVRDVAENAFAAAFHDSRFSPMARSEVPDLSVKISVLTPSEPIAFDSEAHLLSLIQPGEDGLILHAGTNRSVLLPSVWPMVESPQHFLSIMKRKAGLPPDFWSDTVRMERFSTLEF